MTTLIGETESLHSFLGKIQEKETINLGLINELKTALEDMKKKIDKTKVKLNFYSKIF